MSNRPAKPDNMPWMTACFTVKDVDAAAAFYEKAFGFEKRFSMPGPDGRSMHAELSYRDGLIMLGCENEQCPSKSPATSGARPSCGLYLYVEDVDAFFQRATAAGAAVEMAPQDMFWGDRMGSLIDNNGYVWSFATNVADFDPANVPEGCLAES